MLIGYSVFLVLVFSNRARFIGQMGERVMRGGDARCDHWM